MQYIKDPDAVLDYGFDWSRWLNGDEIDTSEWILDEGITKDSDENSATRTTIWLSKGTAGESYTITNRITTKAGRIDDRSFTLLLKER